MYKIYPDESYFGARRVRGVRGKGAKGKIPVLIFNKVESEAINPNDVYGAIDIKISQLDPDQDRTIQLYEQTKQSLRAYSPTL